MYKAGRGQKAHRGFNCTVWNWNINIPDIAEKNTFVLIVPYGIEMANCPAFLLFVQIVLIVPYGIEMRRKDAYLATGCKF